MTTSTKQRSVVVGVDNSPSSDAALEWAVRYASSRRLPVTIVNGAGDPIHSIEVLASAEARPKLHAAARRATEQGLDVVKRLAPDLEAHVATPLKDPREALLDYSTGAAIIVVGTHGRGPVRALLLGSVSAAVSTHASCPVAVVRPPDRDRDGDMPGPVVVGTDGGPSSAAAMEFAFDLASTDGRSLRVVHSWFMYDAFTDPATYALPQQVAEDHERLLAESLAGYTEKYPDVTVERRMPDGDPVRALVDMSEGAFAVVVGSRGRTGLSALLGSVSRDVVERAHCTVVVAKQ